jgi:hypothetical protein
MSAAAMVKNLISRAQATPRMRPNDTTATKVSAPA